MGARLKELLAQGKLVRVFALGQLCHPKLVEMVGWQGDFDAVWLDQEHAGLTIGQIEEAARAARGCGLDTFVRLAATDYASVMRALEAGAGGIMAAMVQSAQEVEQILRWAKFHPRGLRGVNGTGVDGRYGALPWRAYFEQANRDSVVAVQIECAEGLEEVEGIAAVPGVDFLFIGPADLSQSMGIPCQWDHPDLWTAIERVAAACELRNRPWAILPIGPAFAKRAVDLGCRMLSIGIDAWAITRGIVTFKDEYAEYFPDEP